MQPATTMLAMAASLACATIASPLPLAARTVTEGQADTETMQTREDDHWRMTIPVNVEGKGPFEFLLDTGSQRTIVSTTLAQLLVLPPGPSVRIVGLAGAGDAGTAKVSSLDIGQRTVHSLIVPLLDREDIGADGIVGTDSLQDQRIVFDFAANTVHMGDARELGGNAGYEIVVRARQESGRLIMTNGRLDGIRVRIVIDTGSSTTVGNRALQRALSEQQENFVKLYSATGHTLDAPFHIGRRLTVNNLVVGGTFVAFADSPAFAELDLEKKPALFLGMRELREFKRIAIDFAQNTVLFDVPG